MSISYTEMKFDTEASSDWEGRKEEGTCTVMHVSYCHMHVHVYMQKLNLILKLETLVCTCLTVHKGGVAQQLQGTGPRVRVLSQCIMEDGENIIVQSDLCHLGQRDQLLDVLVFIETHLHNNK